MFTDIQGIRTRYIISGEGEAFLLLHGWGAQIERLEPLQTHLEKIYKVYSFDFPGFGQTDYPPVPWSVGDYANWVLAFMDRFEIKAAIILGHSFGGRVSIKLGAYFPERIQKIILVDSAGVRQSETSRRIKIINEATNKVKPFLKYLPTIIRNQVQWKFYSAIGSTDYLTAGRLRDTYSKVISEDLAPILPLIKLPTLLIWGKNDEATLLADANLMQSLIPDSTLVVIEKAGHYSFIDQPLKVTIALDEFLNT